MPSPARTPSPGALALLAALVVALATGSCELPTEGGGGGPGPGARLDGTKPPDDARRAVVERVVDGDTVHLSGLGPTRLIGVDTPETYEGEECFGREATRFTERLLAPGTRVRFVHGREPEDHYGRDLVYLWLPDGRLFNLLLLRKGYAEPLTVPPNDDLADLFSRAASAAGASGRGLWGACPA